MIIKILLAGLIAIFSSSFALAEHCNIAIGEVCPFAQTYDYFLPFKRPGNPSLAYDRVKEIVESRPIANDIASLSETEKVALFGFTQEFYIPINNEIRANLMPDHIQFHNYDFFIQVLDSTLAKLRPFVGVAVRDVDLPPSVLALHIKGNTVKYSAYTSSSRVSEGRENWRYTKAHLHLVMKSLTGRDIENYSAKPEEQEILFARDTSFFVEDRNEIDCAVQGLPKDETCYEIHLRELAAQ